MKDKKFNSDKSKIREDNELIWWPPEPVLELARLAVDSGGDPDAIYRALDPTMFPVSYCFVFLLFIDASVVIILLSQLGCS